MRKPRDFDAELKALGEKAKQLRDRKLHQLGELVIATGADALPVEQLVGLLLAGIENKDSSAKESWRKGGVAFFQRTSSSGGRPRGDAQRQPAGDGGAPPPASEDRA
ncbi:conjugal transfer protein TraD [Sphingomonas koreensis]|nr:conjugal transfer protein TraD [Sphingomonas koreensis]